MIKLNMSDVISVLNMCKPYIITIAVILVIGIVACGFVQKTGASKKESL